MINIGAEPVGLAAPADEVFEREIHLRTPGHPVGEAVGGSIVIIAIMAFTIAFVLTLIVVISIAVPAIASEAETPFMLIAMTVTEAETKPVATPGARDVKRAQAGDVRIPELRQGNGVSAVGEAPCLDEEHRCVGAVVDDSHNLRPTRGASWGVRSGEQHHALLQVFTKPMSRTERVGGLPEGAGAEKRNGGQGNEREGWGFAHRYVSLG